MMTRSVCFLMFKNDDIFIHWKLKPLISSIKELLTQKGEETNEMKEDDNNTN